MSEMLSSIDKCIYVCLHVSQCIFVFIFHFVFIDFWWKAIENLENYTCPNTRRAHWTTPKATVAHQMPEEHTRLLYLVGDSNKLQLQSTHQVISALTLTVTSWNWSLVADPAAWGRLVISKMVLSRTSSRLFTMTSISSKTDFSFCSHKTKIIDY